MSHSDLKERALERKNVKAAYEALETEFSLLRGLLKARQNEGLTQAEIAERMGTKAPAVTRLESSATLKKYAQALGCHLEIKVVDDNQQNAYS
ncbi:MAG: helix-turn-helix transcriptional regulator [Deltaproteobacteria bacterium]|nr:helix-turn-helix transcriptional regulator [Deltaproteobacteria bacterium]